MPVPAPAASDEQHPGLRQSVAADSVGCGLCFSDVRRPGKPPSGSALDSKPCHGAPVECALTCRGHDAGRPRHPAGLVCHRSAAVDDCSDTRVGHSDSLRRLPAPIHGLPAHQPSRRRNSRQRRDHAAPQPTTARNRGKAGQTFAGAPYPGHPANATERTRQPRGHGRTHAIAGIDFRPGIDIKGC